MEMASGESCRVVAVVNVWKLQHPSMVVSVTVSSSDCRCCLLKTINSIALTCGAVSLAMAR